MIREIEMWTMKDVIVFILIKLGFISHYTLTSHLLKW